MHALSFGSPLLDEAGYRANRIRLGERWVAVVDIQHDQQLDGLVHAVDRLATGQPLLLADPATICSTTEVPSAIDAIYP